MKKNRGFTLIELLTVIAILAVILLIAAPTILGVLDKAKKNTFKNQVLLYVEALKTEVALSELDQSDMSLVLPDVGKTLEVDITTIPMDANPGYTGSIIIENKGNNKYTYTLSEVSSDEYKIKENIEAEKLQAGNIIKADTKVNESDQPGQSQVPSTSTVYYEFGDPTTSSTTDYKTLTYPKTGAQAKVFVELDTAADQKRVCIIKNNELACFKNNSVTEEQEHLKQVFGETSCSTNKSLVSCEDDDLRCFVDSEGFVNCYDKTYFAACDIYANGNIDCYD